MILNKKNEGVIRQKLMQSGISSSHVDTAMKQLKIGIDNVQLPKIAIIGFTGVGKSSTLNALFNAGQPTSDIRACTQDEAPIIGDVSKYTGSKGSVIIYDMPGLGEDMASDERHFETYLRVLPLVDVAIWTFHTGDRAMTPMQNALIRLNETMGTTFQSKLMFSINKADAIAPGESAWNQNTNTPSFEQNRNIRDLELYIRNKVYQVLPMWRGEIVTYSAKTRYRLDVLMTAMIKTMPRDRRWLLDSVADVADPRDLMDPQIKAYVEVQRSRETWKK